MSQHDSERVFDKLLIGAGAMKAGTTWLYSVLAQHPEIRFAPEKEIHYFYARHVDSPLLSPAARLQRAKGRYLNLGFANGRTDLVRKRLRWVARYLDDPVDDQWFRNLYEPLGPTSWMAEFSNLNALLPAEAWSSIAERTKEFRVLYILRDPLDRLWSHVKFHHRFEGNESRLRLMSGSDLESFARQDFIWPNSEYGRALDRMKAGLPEGALLVLFHEDIHRDPAAAMRRIEAHLGLPPAHYPQELLTARVNPTHQRPAPHGFVRRMKRDLERIAEEVISAGYDLPPEWNY